MFLSHSSLSILFILLILSSSMSFLIRDHAHIGTIEEVLETHLKVSITLLEAVTKHK